MESRCGALLLLLNILLNVFGNEFEGTFHVYLYTVFDMLFVILACVTYAFIFYRYKESERKRTSVSKCEGCKRKISATQIFQKSRFYIAIVIILKFLLFVTIPDLSYMFAVVIPQKKSDMFLLVCVISFTLSNICDVIIYVFFQPPIRKLLYRKLNINIIQNNVTQNIVKKQKNSMEFVSKTTFIITNHVNHLSSNV